MQRFRFLFLAFCLLFALASRGQSLEDQYIQIYSLIQDADMLAANKRNAEALAKYQQAQAGLFRFDRANPQWNPTVVKFRLADVARKIEQLSASTPSPVVPAPGSSPGTKPAEQGTRPVAGSAELQTQLLSLQEQIRQLQAGKNDLEAKLKEALAVQPAAVDPRELSKAESKIQNLQKENDLLKVSLDQAKTKTADAKDLDLLKKQLAETSQKLAEQTATAKQLDQERRALQRKLESQLPAARNVDAVQQSQTDLATVNEKTRQLNETIQKLTAERDQLREKLSSVSKQADETTALRTENELLKKQLADLKASTKPKGSPEELSRQLAEARTQIALLQSERQVLSLERVALEQQVKQLSARTATNTTAFVMPEPFSGRDQSRIRQLERDKADLAKQLESANRKLSARKSGAAGAETRELEKEVASLRSRLSVLEAAPVPYSPEELALFRAPPTQLAAVPPKKTSATPPPPPAGTTSLVAEARKLFDARDLSGAEKKYQEVLRKDESNASSLANLASIQVELGRLDDAEANIKRALSQYPDDPFSLIVYGTIKYKQNKTDEAFELLSRAVAADPQNAEAQNLLGVVLGQKGQRAAAETALRKALQLEPNHAGAHQNLAVVYVNQKPPAVELARWHYQKARSLGAPPNPELEKSLDAKATK